MKRLAAVALCTITVAACDALGGEKTYLLMKAGDRPLPAELRNEAGCQHVLRNGSVHFKRKGEYTSEFDVQITCGDSVAPPPNLGVTGKYKIQNDTAFFYDAAGRSAGYGSLNEDTLIVTGPVHTLLYLRR